MSKLVEGMDGGKRSHLLTIPGTQASPMDFRNDHCHRSQEQPQQLHPKGNYARTLRVKTIANSVGDTVEVAIVAQPSTGFLNGRFYPDGSPT